MGTNTIVAKILPQNIFPGIKDCINDHLSITGFVRLQILKSHIAGIHPIITELANETMKISLFMIMVPI